MRRLAVDPRLGERYEGHSAADGHVGAHVPLQNLNVMRPTDFPDQIASP
jgi:hypothetical protein